MWYFTALFVPRLRRLACFDRLVLIAGVALPKRRHDGSIDNLPSYRQIAIVAQRGVELVKQGLDLTGLRQLLAIEPARLGVHCPAGKQSAAERGHALFNAQIK
jgi:hypothetical protein